MNMDLIEEMRREASKLPLIVGSALLAVGILLSFTNTSWNLVFTIPGILLIAYGLLSYGAMFVVNSFANIAKSASQKAIPNWDGDILHMDGGEYKIRYKAGHDGSPRFIANDICIAVGVKPPDKNAIKWGGASLLIYEGQFCFSRESVQDFLTPLAIENREANRLLVKLRNEVFRKQDRQL
jgi:hypothetical protein